MATLALFIALGGTSYAVIRVGSDDVIDNSLRSRDIRNGGVLSRDLRDRTIGDVMYVAGRLGSRVVKESALGMVPRACSADRVGGASALDLRLSAQPTPSARPGFASRPPGGDRTASSRPSTSAVKQAGS